MAQGIFGFGEEECQHILGVFIQCKDLFVKKGHNGTFAGKTDHHYITGIPAVANMTMGLSGLVKDDLPGGQFTADTINNGIDAPVVHIHQFPEAVNLRCVVKTNIKFKILPYEF